MDDEKQIEEELLETIRNLFGAEIEDVELDNQVERFLDTRIKLEQSDASWSLDRYLQLYEKLKTYGLEEKMMRNLEFFIRLELKYCKDDFLKSEFFKKFKNHRIVARAKRDYD